MFLQLHDGPELPYGLKKIPYPKYSGKLQPVYSAENPYAAGAPVMQLSPFAVLAGCDPQQIYLDFVPQNGNAWEVRFKQVDQAKQLLKNYQSVKEAAGTGSAPIYDAAGNITGYRQASKAEVVAAWVDLAIKGVRIAQEGVKAGEARRLTDDAQALWNENKWGIQDVCTQSLSQLNDNAQKCYDSLQYWLVYQGDKSKSRGEKRIANRAVALRTNALAILVREIEAKGGSFTPGGKGGAPISAAAILAGLAALTFLRF
jgi:hypothetical protein